jgi:hypothetical protein
MKHIGGILVTGILCAMLVACGGGGNGGTPVLSLSQAMLSFTGMLGIANDPAPQMVSVSNTGNGALNFTATSDSSWLTVVPGTGTAPQSIQIDALLGTLTAGTYTGHVTVTAMGAQGSPTTITVTFMVNPAPSNAAFWAQWGANPQHEGMVNVAGQSVTHQLANIVYDQFVPQEQTESRGNLLAHYQATITDGNDVYMMVKTGAYTPCSMPGAWRHPPFPACGPNAWQSMVWNEARFSWVGGKLVNIWTTASDWKPAPNGFGLGGWEPVFHAVDANNFIYVPGAGGTLRKLDKFSGNSATPINPFSGVAGFDATNAFVSSPLATDTRGNIYYNVIEFNTTGGDPWVQNDVAGAWLVKVDPTDKPAILSYAQLVPSAPAGTSVACPGTFFDSDGDPTGASLPWPPPSPTSPAPQLCGSQRPGMNIAPAVAPDPDGTIYTASRAHFNSMQSYLIAVKSDFSGPKWSASLQNRLSDGCGVLLPIAPANVSTVANSCRFGTTTGVDPTTNAPGSGEIFDQASTSPTVLPDGSVVMGALDNYNFARGHLFKFDSLGTFKGAFNFGWDSTPGVYVHGGTYSVVIKDNHYPSASYCGFASPVCTAVSPGPYFITQLDASLSVIEWQFQSTNIQQPNNPNGFEWCINMPAIDMNGNVYVNSEDGSIYQLLQPPPGTPAGTTITQPGGKLFLNLAIGAAYTPLSIGSDGKLYSQNDGHLFVVGN